MQTGSHDLGTGTYTVMQQVAADALGLPLEKVTVRLGDTRLPDSHASSRGERNPVAMWIGRAGMTETEARHTGRKVRIGMRPMDKVGRAIEKGETRGFMQIIIDSESEAILGAAILGVGATRRSTAFSTRCMPAGPTHCSSAACRSTRQCPS
ncbi:MAG TPA: molybdopterin cofactor-binding domain-containing protein [Gemmatimonadaceae bacterium]